jgi:ferredoxin
MVTRKIVHINEELCNGCGNCIPKCAEGALQIVNGKAKIVKDIYCDGLGACIGHCPQGAITIIEREAENFDEEAARDHAELIEDKSGKKKMFLQWPVKINLVPSKAPFYENADLLIIADCVTIAYPKFSNSLLPGKRVIIACPKFDDVKAHAQKLSEILKQNNIASISVAYMEVPCCSGLNWAVNKAVAESGKDLPIRRHEVKIGGEMIEH